METERSSTRCYSSPPCYAHEIDPGYFGEVEVTPNRELVAPPAPEGGAGLPGETENPKPAARGLVKKS
jgi:hypothetical protein